MSLMVLVPHFKRKKKGEKKGVKDASPSLIIHVFCSLARLLFRNRGLRYFPIANRNNIGSIRMISMQGAEAGIFTIACPFNVSSFDIFTLGILATEHFTKNKSPIDTVW